MDKDILDRERQAPPLALSKDTTGQTAPSGRSEQDVLVLAAYEFQKQHLSREHLKGTMTEEELKHLSTCRFCRETLADYVEAHELLTAPAGLKASILEQSRRPDVQFIAGTNQVSKKLQLFFFGLKVSAAVLCSLALLAIAPGFSKELAVKSAQAGYRIEQSAGRQWSLYDKVDNFTKQLNQLSFTHMEVNEHDKKER